jgi:hypothetical protein
MQASLVIASSGIDGCSLEAKSSLGLYGIIVTAYCLAVTISKIKTRRDFSLSLFYLQI